MKYFDFAAGLTMTNAQFDRLFGGPPRKAEGELTQREMDLARSVQEVTEEAMLRMARHVHRETGERNLCLAGGVALNCVGNGRMLREGPFERVWIQPAAGDAGGSLGAALSVWYQYLGNARDVSEVCGGHADGMRGSYLGPEFSDEEIEEFLLTTGARYRRVARDEVAAHAARLLAEEKVVGWFQGRMEFGPRALGARSILGDPRSPRMQSQMNLKIKFRESFRPFAPSVLRERVSEFFELDADSPYMLLVAPVREGLRVPVTEAGGAFVRHREAERAALDDPGGDARGLLGARADRAARGQPALLRFDPRVRAVDRLPGRRQHLFQRARRADSVHARAGVRVLHADGDGRARRGRLRAAEE